MAVEVFVNRNRIVTLQEEANQFSIGTASAKQILHKQLSLNKVSARWVLKQLTEDYKCIQVQGDHSKRTFGVGVGGGGGVRNMMKISFEQQGHYR